jgi:hypothetical protein
MALATEDEPPRGRWWEATVLCAGFRAARVARRPEMEAGLMPSDLTPIGNVVHN